MPLSLCVSLTSHLLTWIFSPQPLSQLLLLETPWEVLDGGNKGVQNTPLWHNNYFELRALRIYRCRKRLFWIPFICRKVESPPMNSTVTNPLPGTFGTTTKQTLSQNYYTSLLSPKGPFILSESHLFSPKCPFSPPLIKMAYEPQILLFSEFLCTDVKKNLHFLLLISLIHRPPTTGSKRVEERFFLPNRRKC